MFAQVFQGQLADADLWKSQIEVWRREIRPKTTGFLGFTGGITADGYAITVARFESQAKAQVDSELPEQGAWFEQSSKAFATEVIFHDCPEVDLILDGGTNDAGFVQIMQGHATDVAAMRTLSAEMEAELRRIRPDVLGGIVAWHGDGDFTQTTYFSSEKEARENEKTMAESPMMERFNSIMGGMPTFYDLAEVFTSD